MLTMSFIQLLFFIVIFLSGRPDGPHNNAKPEEAGLIDNSHTQTIDIVDIDRVANDKSYYLR